MPSSFERLTREQECERILQVCGPDDYEAVVRALDVQFRLLHNRAQVLLGICGVLLSTSVVLMTGKLIGPVIGALPVCAGAMGIAAAAIVVGGVLRIRWMTQLPGDGVPARIMTSLRLRDSKAYAYRASILSAGLDGVLPDGGDARVAAAVMRR